VPQQLHLQQQQQQQQQKLAEVSGTLKKPVHRYAADLQPL